ncbi:MAG: signal peptide peptidase SppA [Planctomycetota bacterium]
MIVLTAVLALLASIPSAFAKEGVIKSESAANSKASETSEAKGDETPEKKPKKVRIAHIKISGSLPESPGQMSLFGDLGIDLRKTIARLDKAAKDDRIAGVILEIKPAALGRGKLNELRAAVRRVQAAEKKVYAQIEMAMGSQYQLAAACDEIIMPEAGMVLVPGVRLELSYFKDMLSKLGIEADMMHVGDSKGAAEPLTRTSMSEPVRKNLTAMVDDFFDQLVSTIASDRDLKVDEVRDLVDTGLLTSPTAKKKGLVDRIAYPDEFRAQLKEEHEADELVYVISYAKKSIDTDFSSPFAMIKIFQQMMGAGSGSGSSRGSKIAIVYAVGPIMSGKSENDPFGGQSMGSDTIVKALRDADKDKSVKAIVLRINSPGGSALASDMIWRATQQTDKPIVASMGDVAGSGGYYIAMGADKIMAEPGTITGSIGVVGGKLAVRGLYDKIGMSTDLISRGKNSGIFSSTEKFSDSEREVVKNMMQEVYEKFTEKAAAGRNMPVEELKALAGGQVYSGRDAKRNGLVDELGTLKDAIKTAKKLAKLDADEKVTLKILPEPQNPFEAIFGADLDKQREVKLLQGVLGFAPELGAQLRGAVQLRQIMGEPVTLLMPHHLDVR